MNKKANLLIRVAVAVATLVANQAFALGRTENLEAPSGKPVRIFIFFNCTNHTPWAGSAFVDHGTVTYKDVTINRCNNSHEPAREVWYVSPPGFIGTDTVTFPLGGRQFNIFNTFNITVH